MAETRRIRPYKQPAGGWGALKALGEHLVEQGLELLTHGLHLVDLLLERGFCRAQILDLLIQGALPPIQGALAGEQGLGETLLSTGRPDGGALPAAGRIGRSIAVLTLRDRRAGEGEDQEGQGGDRKHRTQDRSEGAEVRSQPSQERMVREAVQGSPAEPERPGRDAADDHGEQKPGEGSGVLEDPGHGMVLNKVWPRTSSRPRRRIAGSSRGARHTHTHSRAHTHIQTRTHTSSAL